MDEPLPLAVIHEAVLTFLRGRDDAVLFGAQAVNAYTDDPRMTQDVDLLSPRAEALALEIQSYLHEQFNIAIRVRTVADGRGYRLYQVRTSGNRHLVDLRAVDTLPATRRIAQILVMAPDELIASKVISLHQRRGRPKAGTDWRDLAMLLLVFPEYKTDPGPVTEHLEAGGATPDVLMVWRDLVAQEIRPSNDEDEFDF